MIECRSHVSRNRSHPPCISNHAPELRQQSRIGFTIIELLVSIFIVAVLAALILPAVTNARQSARRIHCINNLRNLGLGLLSNEETKQRFPPSGTFGAIGPDQYHNWVIEILPWIGKPTISNNWDRGNPRMAPGNFELTRIPISLLECPSDITTVSGMPNLSYVANGGFGWSEPVDCTVVIHYFDDPPQASLPIDLNGNGIVCPSFDGSDGKPSDKDIFLWTGLFFLENEPLDSGTVRHHSVRTVTDGTTHTIMLTENVRAGFDPLQPESTGWSSSIARRSCFFISGYICNGQECSVGNVDYLRANDRQNAPYQYESINASLKQPEGQAPWPSSFHPQGVNALFVDGHVQFLSENIDGSVYASMVSPRGQMLSDGPLAQMIISGTP